MLGTLAPWWVLRPLGTQSRPTADLLAAPKVQQGPCTSLRHTRCQRQRRPGGEGLQVGVTNCSGPHPWHPLTLGKRTARLKNTVRARHTFFALTLGKRTARSPSAMTRLLRAAAPSALQAGKQAGWQACGATGWPVHCSRQAGRQVDKGERKLLEVGPLCGMQATALGTGPEVSTPRRAHAHVRGTRRCSMAHNE